MPETANFLWLSLGVTGALVFGYMLSMWLRYQSLQKDIQLIEQLREDDA